MTVRRFEGDLEGTGLHVGIVVASWNQTITDRLLDGALRRCEQLEVTEITVLRVPGALELPLAAKKLADRGCDAVVAIGTIIRGETDHYDIVVRESSAGIATVSVEAGVPVANAILAVHDVSQAMDRAGDGDSNKGVEGVDAAVRAARAMAKLEES